MGQVIKLHPFKIILPISLVIELRAVGESKMSKNIVQDCETLKTCSTQPDHSTTYRNGQYEIASNMKN